MRHRDPHDEPPPKRRPASNRGPPGALGHKCRNLSRISRSGGKSGAVVAMAWIPGCSSYLMSSWPRILHTVPCTRLARQSCPAAGPFSRAWRAISRSSRNYQFEPATPTSRRWCATQPGRSILSRGHFYRLTYGRLEWPRRISGVYFSSRGHAEATRERLARSIIEQAKRGERDLDRLREDAINSLAQSNVSPWKPRYTSL